MYQPSQLVLALYGTGKLNSLKWPLTMGETLFLTRGNIPEGTVI